MAAGLRIALNALIALALSANGIAFASSSVAYALRGSDNYRIGNQRVTVTYDGRESVAPHAESSGRGYFVTIDYVTNHREKRSMRRADDPNKLSVLNQPLPYEISARQLRAITTLSNRFPFDFHLSDGAGALSGYLEPAPKSPRSDVVGIAFAAKGPMQGPLPGTSHSAVSGELMLSGTAYYFTHSRRLVVIDDTITFDGYVGDARNMPVHISYKRKIYALPPVVVGKRGAS